MNKIIIFKYTASKVLTKIIRHTNQLLNDLPRIMYLMYLTYLMLCIVCWAKHATINTLLSS